MPHLHIALLVGYHFGNTANLKLTSIENTFFTIIIASDYSDIEKTKAKADIDEKYVLDLCDIVLVITSLRQYNFDYPIDGYYYDFKIAVAYCEKQNTDSVNYFSTFNFQLIEISYADFNCDKQSNIIQDTVFDEKVVRKKLPSLS